MNAIDCIKMSLEMSNDWIMGMAEDMKEAPFTAPTSNGGNHPMWCVGHLAYSEANLVNVLIKGEENPLAKWEGIFKQGLGDVKTDPSEYPPYEEVLAKLQEMRVNTMALLDTLTEADLDKPSHAEGDMKDFFGTVGNCLAVIPVHFGFHGGQLADARRTAGKQPMMG